MSLVQSLLTAIVRADGDALVMHVGERPYVIASAGTIELSRHGLNLEAMSGMLNQLLPQDALRALDDFGAVEHELSPSPPIAGERFTVVAARGGDDVWIELRRHRRAGVATVHEAEEPAAVASAAPAHRAETAAAEPPKDAAAPTGPPPSSASPDLPSAPSAPAAVVEVAVSKGASLDPAPSEPLESSAPVDLGPAPEDSSMQPEFHEFERPSLPSAAEPGQERLPVNPPVPPAVPPPLSAPFSVVPPLSSVAKPHAGSMAGDAEASPESDARADPPSVPAAAPSLDHWPPPAAAEEPGSVVVPLTRNMRIETPPRGLSSRPGGIDRLLRLASSRGASALYLSSQGRPHIRVDGDIRPLEGEPPLSSTDVESAVLELMPESARDALRRGEPTEWVSDLADIGRIRCTTFRDYRGPGALFQMISARAASAEQLGLSREIQALSTESEGLVIVAGPRGSGKSTLIAAFVDLVNRRRADYVITLERQIRLVHDNRSSLISQREIRGSAEEIVAQARAALRENPDVLVIEDLRSPEVLQVALDAAGSGLLVFISVTAASATAALERVIDLVPADKRRGVQAMLGETLRGVVAQVLLRKSGGGRLAARELVLNTAAVASLVTDGQTSQLPLAIDSGRRHGMVPLNDALVAFVQSGAVDVREVYRKAADRAGLLTLLKREGIDTSFAERLA